MSEPVVTKEWHRVPEPEPEPRRRKLDTEPVYIARIDYLEGKLAEVLPAIDTMFQNINESWLDLKKRAETAEKQLVEVNKRLADLQSTHELDIRDVKLSIREERMAHNSILISSRIAELKWLADATVAAYERGQPYLVPGSADAPASMTLREALIMLQYEMPRQHCLSWGHQCKIK